MSNRRQQLLASVAVLKAKFNANNGAPAVGGIALTDKTIYISKSLKGAGGIVKLIDVNTKKEVGVTNFDGNKLNVGRDYVIDGVRILYDTTATNIKNANWLKYPASETEVANCEIRIKQDNQMLLEMPVTDMTNFNYDEFRDISTSPIIRSGEEFEIELEFPQGVSIANDNEVNIRLEFRVHQGKK